MKLVVIFILSIGYSVGGSEENIFERTDYFASLYNGTNWCAAILVGLPYHIDTEFLRAQDLKTLELKNDDKTNHHYLGPMQDVDFCCHSYHHCVESAPGLTDLELDNPKKSQHCICDFNLRRCLRETNTPATNSFGRVYFFMTEQCFMDDHPIVHCDQSDTIFYEDDSESRCIQYTKDTTELKEFQFFDLPFYYNQHERKQLNIDF